MSDTDLPDIIANFQTYKADTYLNYSCLCLAFHEYFITLKYEWTCWQRGNWSSATTWLFFATRYVMLANAIQQSVPYTSQANVELGLSNWCWFFSAYSRTFALCRHCSVLSIAHICTPTAQPQCTAYSSDCTSSRIGSDTNKSPSLASRLSLIAADIIVLIVTWFKTIRQVKQLYSLGYTMSLSTILLRDGSLFFVILLALNIVILVNNALPDDQPLDQGTIIFEVLQPILLARFLMHLRQAGPESSENSDPTSNDSKPVRFYGTGPVLDNAGETLEFGLAEPWHRGAHELSSESGNTPRDEQISLADQRSNHTLEHSFIQEESREAAV
ncbi:hypothetical protein NM688_g1680 [Phlebia brevispora]|uniref:Uncharacterized protein n=1 Tax=Phlebia brevispora TaxID=194682 RepID=A0ACC1TB13_9APHY|nr:hypothetical protein NM688_g1680 [Phlebia brevispora]